MKRSKVSQIKQAQKESFYYSELALFFIKIAQDDKILRRLSLNRVSLSDKGAMCTVFFVCEGGKKEFDLLFSQLVLYKPTIRQAFSKVLSSRRCPELRFEYDMMFEKTQEIERLIDSLKKDDGEF